MARRNRNKDFLLQGGTLAMAAIVGRMIGLIYRIPLTSMIGDLGNNYYGCAFDVYHILLLMSSYSLPQAVSRLVSGYRTRGELKNAYKAVKCAFVFAFAVGILTCAFVFFGARFLSSTLFQTPLSIYAMRVLAPTLLITALLGVLRGFFQGMENMYPSAVSQILEQIVNAIVSVLAAYFLSSYGKRVGKVLADEEGCRAAYGAAGASLGTTAGALVSLLFLYLLYKGYLRYFKKKMRRQQRTKQVSTRSMFRAVLFTVLPILAASALFNVNIVVEQVIFKHMMTDVVPDSQIALWWGIFSGKFKTLVNLPVAVAVAIGTACIPSITASYERKDAGGLAEKTDLAIRYSMLIALPASFALMLLASPIMEFLFQDKQPLSSGLLLAGGVTVIFYSLAAVTSSILQGIGNLRAPLINSAVALALHVLTLVLLLRYTKLYIYSVVVAMIVFGVIVMVLNQISLYRSGYWVPEFYRTFLLPGVCAAIMASVCWVVEFALSQVIPTKYVTVPIAVALGLLSYGMLLLQLRALSVAEMRMFPGGRKILKLIPRKMRYI